jgi:4-amino-4-deoxy-L-arabinose transferase-like glycosyltransferase
MNGIIRRLPTIRPRAGHLPPILVSQSIILLAVCLFLFCQRISSRELWASHEARAAQNAQRMLDDGNWLLPRLYDGQMELQKPPGYYWLVAMVGSVRGEVDAIAVRLPSALAGLLTVLMVWWHLQRRGRPIAGFIAGAMLAGAVHFTGTARIGRIDVPLACVIAAIVLVSLDPGAPGSRLTKFFFVGLLGGAALFLKGPIGVVLPAAALSVYALVERIPRRRWLLAGLVMGSIALLVALPWYLWYNASTDGEFFRVFFLYHHFNRAFGGAETLAGHPWWFYLPRFAADFLPWTPLLLVALATRRWRGDADARFGLIWLLTMIAVLSLSRFKRADYLLPAYAGAAIFLGCAVERYYLARSARSRKRLAVGFVVLLAFLPAGWFVFDRIVTAKDEAAHEQRPFAMAIRENCPKPEPILLFQVESHLLAYHLGRPVHTLVEWADLRDRLNATGPHFIVIRSDSLDEFRLQVPVPMDIVVSSVGTNRAHPQRPLTLLRIDTQSWPNPPKD